MRQSITVVLILTLVTLAACTGSRANGKAGGKGGPGGARQQAAVVSVATVTTKSVPLEVQVVGNVEPSVAIRVRPQVSGQLTKVHFREGQDIRQGAPLFLIDPRPFDEAIRQAEANLARNTALLRQAEANLKRDIAQERYARDQAARYQKLFEEGVMAKQQAEQFTASADALTETIKADQAAIESAQAAVRADTSTLANVRLQRSYCEIASPVDGRAGDLLVEEGNLVRATDSELVTINKIHPVFVTFSVPERRLAEVKRHMAAGGLEVLANPAGESDTPERGKLTFVDNTIDPATGTIKLKGTFANPSGRLWPGQFVNVVLRLTTLRDATVVPSRAVEMGQGGEYVYVVKSDQTAELRPVTTAARFGQETVVEKGLDRDEVVVIEGQLRLVPGMKVRINRGK